MSAVRSLGSVAVMIIIILLLLIIIIGEIAFLYVAGYFIEGRRRWPAMDCNAMLPHKDNILNKCIFVVGFFKLKCT